LLRYLGKNEMETDGIFHLKKGEFGS